MALTRLDVVRQDLLNQKNKEQVAGEKQSERRTAPEKRFGLGEQIECKAKRQTFVPFQQSV